MHLLDTNIWLERLLDQARSEEVGNFLDRFVGTLSISEFSLYSIGIILCRAKKHDLLLKFFDDVVSRGAVRVVRLSGTDLKGVPEAARQYGLDFDDAYQYVAAELYDLSLISLDADFDKTPRGRKTPSQLLSTPS
jgi:uncharacterized protein